MIEFELRNVFVSQALVPRAQSSWGMSKSVPVAGGGWGHKTVGYERERGTMKEYVSVTKELLAHDDNKKQMSFKSVDFTFSADNMCLYLLHGWGHSHS